MEEYEGSSGLDSAILTFDPNDPSICYTLHAPKKEHRGTSQPQKRKANNPNTAGRLNINYTGGLSPPRAGDKESCRPTFFCSLELTTWGEKNTGIQRAAIHSPAYFFKG